MHAELHDIDVEKRGAAEEVPSADFYPTAHEISEARLLSLSVERLSQRLREDIFHSKTQHHFHGSENSTCF